MKPVELPDMKMLRETGVIATIEESGSVLLSYTDVSIILVEIEVAAKELEGCFESLPPNAKASALKLAHSLSAIKSKLQCKRTVKE